MQNFHWNDGLNIGIESIDNDHKKLLSLITELSNAIQSNHTSDVIENIFLQLEEYIVAHFSREEALMKESHYSDLENHIKQHQDFVKKVPELKQKLLSADTRKVSQEVNVFLYNWLMNHIIGEDFNFAQQVYKLNLADEKPPRHKGISIWLSEHFVLNNRLVFATILPVVALFILSFFLFWKAYEELVPVQNQLELIPLVSQVNSITHNLQIERGLSIAYLALKNIEFHSKLSKQYKYTDQEINIYKQKVEAIIKQPINNKATKGITLIENHLIQLVNQRKETNIDSTFKFYSRFITSLLDITENITHQKMSSKIAHNFTAISAISNLKEMMGLERAMGSLAIEQGYLSTPQFRKFIQLIGQKKGFLKTFKNAATIPQISQLELIYKEKSILDIEQTFFLSAEENRLSSMNSQTWFNVLSKEINQLKKLNDFLINDLTTHTNLRIDELKRQLYLIGIGLILVLTITLFTFLILKRSITVPINRLTHALNDLAFGNKDVMLKDTFADDELGLLLESYEKCRRRLLQADISSSIDFIRLDVELNEKRVEKDYYEKLSSIDPLTGAVNRRKLSALAMLEIERTNRFDRSLSVMMLDIDFFKKINDIHGHAIGDKVLISFFKTCQKLARNIDTIARIGGEEFVILMPETDLQQAAIAAERVRLAIEKQTYKLDDTIIKYTVSIGVASWDKITYNNFEGFLQEADQRLYKAKGLGRNGVVSAS